MSLSFSKSVTSLIFLATVRNKAVVLQTALITDLLPQKTNMSKVRAGQ